MGSTILDAVRFVAAAPTGPANATAQTVGTPGQAQYYYWVVTHYPIGAVASGPFFVRNAPDLLSLQNYVAVSWNAQVGATGYDLLRTTTPLFPQVAGNYAVWINVINNYLTDDDPALAFYNPQALAWGAPVATQIHFNNRDYNLPTLEIPGQLRVGTLMFSDGTQQTTAASGGGGGSQTPWLQNVNANGFSLQNANAVDCVGVNLGGTIGVQPPYIQMTMSGNLRWAETLFNSESGSNAGSDWSLSRYSDTGAYLGSPIQVTRSNGNVFFTGEVIVNQAIVANGGVAAAYFVANPGQGLTWEDNSWMVYSSGGTFFVRDLVNANMAITCTPGNPSGVSMNFLGIGVAAQVGFPLFIEATNPPNAPVFVKTNNANSYPPFGFLHQETNAAASSGAIFINDQGATFQLELLGSTAGNGLSVISVTNALTLQTNGANRIWITAAGLVGIGTTGPAYPLHIEAPAPNTQVAIQNATGTAGTGLIIGDASRSYFLGNNLVGAAPGEFQICDASVSVCRISITSSGMVGIGTTNPTDPLDLNYTSTNDSAAGFKVTNLSAGHSSSIWMASGHQWSIEALGTTVAPNNGLRIVDYTAGLAPLFLTSAGFVGIGWNAPPSPLSVLDVATGGTSFTIETPNKTSGFVMTHINSSSQVQFAISDQGWLFLGLGAPSTGFSYLLQLSADSAAKPATSTWTIASDIRIKQNIEPLDEDSTAILRRIDWQRFEYNGLACTQQGARTVGLTAGELQKILPEAVRTVRGRLHPEDEEDTDLLGIDYHYLFVRACRAVQELDQRLAKLENKKHK